MVPFCMGSSSDSISDSVCSESMKALMNKFETEKRVKLIKEELAFIGRYLGSISPKLSRYAELQKRKEELREELKAIHKQYPKAKEIGTNPQKMKEIDTRMPDVVGIIGSNRDKVSDKSYQTVRTNRFTK